MRLHSMNGLVSNSSTSIYTWNASENEQEELVRKVGEMLIEDVGLEDTFDDLFEVKRVVSDDAFERILDGDMDHVVEDAFADADAPDEAAETWREELDLGVQRLLVDFYRKDNLDIADGDRLYIFRLTTETRREAFVAQGDFVAKQVQEAGIELPENYENHMYFPVSNYEYQLVSKKTGKPVPIGAYFGTLYEQDGARDG